MFRTSRVTKTIEEDGRIIPDIGLILGGRHGIGLELFEKESNAMHDGINGPGPSGAIERIGNATVYAS